jgi:hypothetical protein
LNRWSSIKAYALVKKGIVPIYTNRNKAFDFWKRYKKDHIYKGNTKMKKVHDEMVQKLLTDDTIEEVNRDDLTWINPTNLVKKENGKYRLVIDTRG